MPMVLFDWFFSAGARRSTFLHIRATKPRLKVAGALLQAFTGLTSKELTFADWAAQGWINPTLDYTGLDCRRLGVSLA
jgi:hypothetical protein